MITTYKDSVNLPQTDFAMKAALPTREPLLLRVWSEQNLYDKIRQKHQGKTQYILHDGPPYANGHLHIGHALNKILKDFIVKSKSLSGLDAPFIPGWDCHGLPIELNVEKQFKNQKKSYTPQEFRMACRTYAQQQIDIQKKEFKRLGVLADWERPYATMDFKVEANIIRALGECVATHRIQSGLKPVHWCVACQSALAELEVGYQDKISTAIDVKFKVIKAPSYLQNIGHGDLFIPIWTTTPWTLPANEAVAIGPQIEYCLIQTKNERFLLAKDLYEECLSRYGLADQYTILEHLTGDTLSDINLQHPLEPRHIPLILSNHVLTDKGTGAVHIAPSHGPEDYLLGLKHALPIRMLVDGTGRYSLTNPTLSQQSVLKADHLIIDLLIPHEQLLAQDSFRHSYPHCWRHKIPLIFRATPQWFLRLQDTALHEQLANALEAVHWIPEWGQARMRTMLGDHQHKRPDWCLSRQRHWGVPLPFFVHKQTGQYHPNTSAWIEEIAQAVEKEGIEAWYTLDSKTFLKEEARDYYKLEDVLDVWFDSGVTHTSVLHQDNRVQFPADLYLEGSDQFRGWFQSSLITSVVLKGQAPYRQVLTHGFTVDAKGQKMSKSLGNTLPLDTIVQKWGADILRLWIASTDTRSEIVISEETFQRTAEAYRRIRNTLRFLLGSLHDFDSKKHSVSHSELISMDRWLLSRVISLQKVIQEAYDNFNFPVVYQTIHHFCMNELGSMYLSILKDRQYTMQPDSVGRRSGQTALYHTAEAMLRWLAPILSFTAEESWQHLPQPRESSIFLTEWYSIVIDETTDPLYQFYQEIGGCEKYWEVIIKVRETVNQAIENSRKAGDIGSALEANLIIYIQSNSFIGRSLKAMQEELHFIFLTSSVKLVDKNNELSDTEITVEVLPIQSSQSKCVRCWHRREEVGSHQNHPALCNRCIQNLPDGIGEKRCYA